jgi:proline iminopeptidase
MAGMPPTARSFATIAVVLACAEMMKLLLCMGLVFAGACGHPGTGTGTGTPRPTPGGYFDNSGRDDIVTGGVKMIPITTPKGTFRVWTKRVGNNPTIKVLLLHGGPGMTHEYNEVMDSYFPGAGIEYYYYDQLGSAYSDQPKDDSLWDLARFVEEVEQVRLALGLDKTNFYLMGQSWGGLLAMEYALKYQQNLKGLVISNMMASVPAYNAYARVLESSMDPKVVAEIRAMEAAGKTEDPHYFELLLPYYQDHILRAPFERWPEPLLRSFGKLNRSVYVTMQGPSEMGLTGRLETWDRSADLKNITVPTLVIGAVHDTMDPKYMRWMSEQLPAGHYLECPNSGHGCSVDVDSELYFRGLIDFILAVDRGDPLR